MSFGNLSELPAYQPPPIYPTHGGQAKFKTIPIFIFRLPSTTDESGFESLFLLFDEIVSTKLYRHAENRASRGFGFMGFGNPLSAHLAIQFMNGFPIENKKLLVYLKQPEAQPTAENQNEIVDLPLHFHGIEIGLIFGVICCELEGADGRHGISVIQIGLIPGTYELGGTAIEVSENSQGSFSITVLLVHPTELSQMVPAENYPFRNQANTPTCATVLPCVAFTRSLPTLLKYSIPQPSTTHPSLCPPQLCCASGQYYLWMSFGNLSELPAYQPPPIYPTHGGQAKFKTIPIFIFRLPSTTDESGFESLFLLFDEIVSTKLYRHAENRASRGFGFMGFGNPLSAHLAIQFMNGFPIENKKLLVYLKQPEAQPTAENQNEIVDLPLHFHGIEIGLMYHLADDCARKFLAVKQGELKPLREEHCEQSRIFAGLTLDAVLFDKIKGMRQELLVLSILQATSKVPSTWGQKIHMPDHSTEDKWWRREVGHITTLAKS
nr:hypothetical transcript [Hymenolepis microstoma]